MVPQLNNELSFLLTSFKALRKLLTAALFMNLRLRSLFQETKETLLMPFVNIHKVPSDSKTL